MIEEEAADATRETLARVQCPCGFAVVGSDEEQSRLAYEGHDCSYHEAVVVEYQTAWYELLFQGRNWMIWLWIGVFCGWVIWGLK